MQEKSDLCVLLFALFALAALIMSALGHVLGWEVVHPGTKEIVKPVNLLSHDGIHRVLLEMVNNFTGFAPLGIVLVAMLGIGIAEQSGLINAVIRVQVLNSPRHLLTFVVVFTGILSSVASDVGYVLLIPLAGLSQVVYRIGDSVTNVISPMMSFFALIIAYVQKYEPKTGIGTIIAAMVPYSIVFMIFWTLLLVLWLLLGLPLGPDAGIHYTLPS